MAFYRFDWKIFVTDELLALVAGAAGPGLDAAAARARLEPVLAELLRAMGGLPVARREYTPAERTQAALDLLCDALERALAGEREREVPGWVLSGADGAVPSARAFRRVKINTAPAAALERLPLVGRAAAARIVAERRRRPFDTPADLAARIDGIGEASAAALSPSVSYAPPGVDRALPPPRGFAVDFQALASFQPGADALERAEAALEWMLVSARTAPYPPSPALLNEYAPPAPGPALAAGEVTLLWGSSYYERMLALIAAAASRVDVCMFHIALPTGRHPVARLIAALVDAQARGAAVRVLADRDRADDPYLSTIINQPALQALRAGGVAVRVDAEDTLLHSKFVLIDDDLTVTGSHNWSAGSFFAFDDLSLAIRSREVAAAQQARFDALWAAGT